MGLRIFDAATAGLPIPDPADSAALFQTIVDLIDRHCRENPKIAYYRVMDHVWQELPKPIQSAEMAADDLGRLLDVLKQESTEEEN